MEAAEACLKYADLANEAGRLSGNPTRGPWKWDAGALSGFVAPLHKMYGSRGSESHLRTGGGGRERAASGCGQGGSTGVRGRKTPRASARVGRE